MSLPKKELEPATIIGKQQWAMSGGPEGISPYDKDTIVAIENRAILTAVKKGTGIHGVNEEMARMVDLSGNFATLYKSQVVETSDKKAKVLLESITSSATDLHEISVRNFETSPHALRASDPQANILYAGMALDLYNLKALISHIPKSLHNESVKSFVNLIETNAHVQHAQILVDAKEHHKRNP